MRRRKLIATLGSICLILVLAVMPFMAACAPPEEEEAPPAPLPEEEVPTFDLKLQGFLFGGQQDRDVGVVCPLIEAMTNGTVKVTPYYAGELCGFMETFDAVRTGAVDMAEFSGGYSMGKVPVDEILGGLPYCLKDENESQFFMWNRGFVDILREEFAKHNIYIIPQQTYGRDVMTNKPIRKIADLEGMTMRGHSSLNTWLELCGASTTYIPAPEIMPALTTGVVDGATWGDAGPTYEFGLQEVLKYYMWPDPIQAGAWNVYFINMDVWNSFTPEQQKQVEWAVRFGGLVVQHHSRLINERALVSFVEDYGVEIVELSEAEQAKAAELAMQSWEVIAAKDPACAKVIDMLKAFMAEEEVVPELEVPYPW